MPSFQAINVEPEENIEDEIDTQKELQVDNALKLFQKALKLHAQGPDSFDEAEKVYNELFESEIFKYPEAATEYDRAQQQPDQLSLETPPATATATVFPPELTVVDPDGVGSSLPQALYLAHKNRGQLYIDRLRHEAGKWEGSPDDFFRRSDVLESAHLALTQFYAALDRDPSDAELWRRAARVAAFLRSTRTSRYCLEAAVELDDDPAVLEVPPPSLVEGLAGQQLKDQLSVLSDSIALNHPILDPWRERQVPKLFERFLDPIPFLPNPAEDLGSSAADYDKLKREKVVVKVDGPSWKDVGLALIQFISSRGICGDALTLEIPDLPDEDVQMAESASINGERDDDGQHDSPSAQLRAEVETPEEIQPKAESDGDKTMDERPTDERQKSSESSTKDRGSIASRKRSQSVAGVTEGAEEDAGPEKRSKRTRRRETQAEEAVDPSALHASKIAEYQAADKNLFQMTKDILENLGVDDKATLDALAGILESCDSEERLSKLTDLASNDLRAALTSFNEPLAKILTGTKEQPSLSLSSFLEHAKGSSQKVSGTPAFDETRGLKSFVDAVNSGWYTIHDVATEWVKRICSSYTTSKWSDDMKTTAVQLISKADAELYSRMAERISALDQVDDDERADFVKREFENVVQMLFELHLDVFERITNPNSIVESSVRLETRGRLERWQDLALMTFRRSTRPMTDPVCLRFIWASIFATSVLDTQIRRDHILQCYASFRNLLAANECEPIYLPNNAVIDVISLTGVDREISKLTTMDFFMGLFHDEIDDPVSVIDSLEPVLNPSSVFVRADRPEVSDDRSSADLENGHDQVPIKECASQRLHDLWKFLESSNTELRLFLWSRLGEAYGAISYTTKQFSCRLRSIEMIVDDLTSDPYLKTSDESRGTLLMRLLKSLDELLIQALTLALNEAKSFEIIDEDHLRSSSSALAKVNCLLHTAAICEDEMRIASTLPSPASTSALQQFLTKLREMQTRAWSLQYTLIRAGIRHNSEIFTTPDSDLAEFLAAVHHVLGIRKFCKASNKTFLKMMRVELLKLPMIENWEDYLGQVLYDLHGLKLGVGMWEVEDHECPPEKLEKRNTIHLVERITVLASRMPLKELLKSDLKATIERMQQTMGQTKTTPQTIHNLRNFTEFLKRPIHPLRLMEARKGNVMVDAVSVNNTESAIAKHGWFFLLGMIALTKFKGVDLNRRQTPGATDDLRMAATFMRMQLQYTPGRWDAWFRLAECFDYELDEAVLWTADKINKDRAELVKLQRSAIHCYTLALSNSRGVDPEGDEAATLHELYYKFGMRMYASSREPFAMEAFQNADQKRFSLSYLGSWTNQPAAYPEVTEHRAWNYAAWLFRKAMAIRPKDWKSKYMYSKCLWKLYQRDGGNKEALPRLFSALQDAAAAAAAKPKSRHSDPVLEPHYKILSVVHKLVMRGDIDGGTAGEILSKQPFGLPFGEDKSALDDRANWVEYIIRSLRHLRDKDKSNWQHRLIMRHAHILFDDDRDDDEDNGMPDGGQSSKMRAQAAFSVLRESMFTKTMVMNVWKCDSERPGRHHVYTEQYVRFAVKLLVILENRTDLEALLRRIRKKGADFYHFSDLWASSCSAYLGELRRAYDIGSGPVDEAFKAVGPEEFEKNTEKVVEYAIERTELVPVRCLREAIELKKLNSSLMKATAIDDLICDCYAMLYFDSPAGDELDELMPGVASAPQSPKPPSDEHKEGEGAEKEGLGDRLLAPGADGAHPNSPTEADGDKENEPAPAPTETASRPRRTGVRRADILRKAEYLVQRLLEPKAEPGSKSRGVSVSSGRNAGASRDASDVEMEDVKDEAGEADAEGKDEDDEKDDGGVGGDEVEGERDEEEGKEEGSVHEADESDLSEVPQEEEEERARQEEEKRVLLFPNLRRGSEGASKRRKSDDVGEEGCERGLSERAG